MAGSADEERPHDDEDEESANSSSLSLFLRELAFVPHVERPGGEHARIGETIDRFQITGLLGRGGMGVVYSAIDLTLKRKVALKLLPVSAGESAEQRHRFHREARLGAAVSHPNIAAVFDAGEADGVVFIAMECVEGRSLRAVMEAAGAALPENEAVQIAREIARGLAAAHEVGVTHRDVKPENVMISHKGVVKLVDFGLAKARGVKGAPGALESTYFTTRKGRLLGTPSYMSPEQVRGRPADARSDVFAFGVVLFEMLARARPFRGAAVADLHTAILRDVPQLLPFLRDGARGPLARIVSRCLAKEPSQRYAHAGELLAALEDTMLTMARTLPRPSQRRRRVWLASPIIAAAVMAAVQSFRAPTDFMLPPQPPSTATVVMPDTREPTSTESDPPSEPPSSIAPFRLPIKDSVTALSLSRTALALTSRGDILMWSPTPATRPTWVKVDAVPHVRAIATSVSEMASMMMAVDRAGKVWVWTDWHTRPVRLDNASGIRAVAISFDGVLLLREDGAVSTIDFAARPNSVDKWSDFWTDKSRVKRAAIETMPGSGIDHVKAISAQLHLWLTLCENGTVWSWGHLERQPGSGLLVANPRRVQGIDRVVAIASGNDHSLALDQDGTVWAWGDDTFHQVGHERQRDSAAKVPGLPKIKAIAAGPSISLALDEAGRVWEWGMHFPGDRKMIAHATQESYSPHVVDGLPRARLIGSTRTSAFAVAVADGGLWAWGVTLEDESWNRDHDW